MQLEHTQNEKIQPILALLFSGLALFLLIALFTSAPADSSTLVFPAAETAVNKCGRVGAGIAETLLFTMGYASYAIVAMLLGWATVFWMRAPLPDLWARLVGSSLILLCLAVLASMNGAVESAAMPGYGGVVGEATSLYLENKFGRVGTFLIAGMVCGISLVLATETMLVQGSRRFGSLVVEGWRQWNEERRKRVGELREKWEADRQVRDEQRQQRQAELAKKRAVKEEEDAARRAEREAEKAKKRAEKEEARRASELESSARKVVDAQSRRVKAEAQKSKAREKKQKSRSKAVVAPTGGPYQLPPTNLLEEVPKVNRGHRDLELADRASMLEEAFEQFGIEAKVVHINQGPTIAQFECELAAGIKLSRVTALSNDLAMALQATSVAVVAPLPGRGTFGVEIPNESRELVFYRELLESDAGKSLTLPLVLGKTIEGIVMASDLARMPHLLIAGTTGSGKSFCINAIIVSLLYHCTPDDLKLILVDPKQVELAPFSRVPHLICPTVTDPEKAAGMLEWSVQEMEKRYQLFKMMGVRGINTYRELSDELRLERWLAAGESEDNFPGQMPFIVIIIDELADLMYTSSKDVEKAIVRLAQKSRAAGIHLVLATQRPSVDVVTGLIKANMPCRISFRVNSVVDSRTILDTPGGEKLLGKGDMYFRSPDGDGLMRAQGTFLSDEEVARVVQYVSQQGAPQFCEQLVAPKLKAGGADEDLMFNDAVRIVLEQQRGSASLLQRALAIGYTRASRLIDIMEEKGILGPHKGSKAREILVTLDEWEDTLEGD